MYLICDGGWLDVVRISQLFSSKSSHFDHPTLNEESFAAHCVTNKKFRPHVVQQKVFASRTQTLAASVLCLFLNYTNHEPWGFLYPNKTQTKGFARSSKVSSASLSDLLTIQQWDGVLVFFTLWLITDRALPLRRCYNVISTAGENKDMYKSWHVWLKHPHFHPQHWDKGDVILQC